MILIVEDDARSLDLRIRAFEAAGVRTIGVGSHLDAVQELVGASSVDLVVTDIHLSSTPDDKSGIDLAQYIRRTQPDIPVVGYSAVFAEHDLVDGQDAFDVVWAKGRGDSSAIDEMIADCCARAVQHQLGSVARQASSAASRPVKVFLCHASEDKATVTKWAEALASRGYDVWLDALRLLPGDDWEREIRAAVQVTDVVVVALSARSINKIGYIQKEIRIVLDAADDRPEGRTFVIPARLDDAPVPDRLRRWHWIDARDELWLDRLEEAFRKLRPELSE